jgi:hypothetical protein
VGPPSAQWMPWCAVHQVAGAGARRDDAAAVAGEQGCPLPRGHAAVGASDVQRDAVPVEDDRGEVRVAGDPPDGFGGQSLAGAGRGGGGVGVSVEGRGGEGDVQLGADSARGGALCRSSTQWRGADEFRESSQLTVGGGGTSAAPRERAPPRASPLRFSTMQRRPRRVCSVSGPQDTSGGPPRTTSSANLRRMTRGTGSHNHLDLLTPAGPGLSALAVGVAATVFSSARRKRCWAPCLVRP